MNRYKDSTTALVSPSTLRTRSWSICTGRLFVVCVGAFFGLEACVVHFAPAESNPVPLKDALLVLDRDLRATSPARLGDVEDPKGKLAIIAAMETARCADNSPNPLEPIITGAIAVALQGSITKASGGTGTISTAPSLGYTYTVTGGQQQQVTIPITFVPLRTVPDFYLGQNLANFNGMSDDAKKPYVEALLKKRRLLIDLIIGLPPYDASVCTNDQKNPIVPFNLRID
jgi:hypothetical protein